MSAVTKKQFRVFMIDSVGAERGMHYYNFALVSALNRLGTKTLFISTSETTAHPLRPEDVPVRSGYRGIYGNNPKWIRGLRYTLALLRIAWWSWREKPDIAHFHFAQIPFLDYLLLSWLKLLGIKTIITVHDVLPFELGTDFASARGKIYSRLYACSSGLIVHSKHTRNCLDKLGSQLLQKLTLIPQGNYSAIGMHHLIPRKDAKLKLGLVSHIPVILVFGTIKPNKRLDLVLEAMTDVLATHPEAKLVVAGKPQDYDVSQNIDLAKRLGLTANILWKLEYISDEEMMWYYSAADVAVFPYQWIYQSAALIMAMSFGKPIIATSVGSNAEIIENNKTGLLVHLDAKSIGDSINYVLTHEENAFLMGKKANEYVTSELSWDTIAKSTIEFYLRVLE